MSKKKMYEAWKRLNSMLDHHKTMYDLVEADNGKFDIYISRNGHGKRGFCEWTFVRVSSSTMTRYIETAIKRIEDKNFIVYQPTHPSRNRLIKFLKAIMSQVKTDFTIIAHMYEDATDEEAKQGYLDAMIAYAEDQSAKDNKKRLIYSYCGNVYLRLVNADQKDHVRFFPQGEFVWSTEVVFKDNEHVSKKFIYVTENGYGGLYG